MVPNNLVRPRDLLIGQREIAVTLPEVREVGDYEVLVCAYQHYGSALGVPSNGVRV